MALALILFRGRCGLRVRCDAAFALDHVDTLSAAITEGTREPCRDHPQRDLRQGRFRCRWMGLLGSLNGVV